MESFCRKNGRNDDPDAGRNAERDFHGEKSSNETHASSTDPDARLYRKGKESRLCYMGHGLVENRNGLAVGGGATKASGTAEREHALEAIDGKRGTALATGRITLGGNKAYEVTAFVANLRARQVTPHVARDDHVTKTGKRHKSAVHGRTTRHPGYDLSRSCRKRIEEVFAWVKKPWSGSPRPAFEAKDASTPPSHSPWRPTT